ncbi:MAG: hypothetical protein HUU46_13510 [Candidatus Hydrogenedentes bacterium]|nr:hypothetical protein [Candidatus Hydrogenedentota bacterium]
MKIVLTMVAIALGLGIAVVAGVYGWQQYESTRTAALPTSTTQTPTMPTTRSATNEKPKPVDLPAAKSDAAASAPSATTTRPADTKPAAPPTQAPTTATTPLSPTPTPATPTSAAQSTPGEDTPIAVPAAQNVATPEKLGQLITGMTEADVIATMGSDGVETPEDELGAYTPAGWYEVRWPNPDGSYIAALFSDQGTLAHVEPFNMPGAYEWLATPWYAVPKWLNEKLTANNMPIRVPAVDVILAQTNTYQFRGVLANADGVVVGVISGSYYVDDPSGRFTRAMEGTYEYAMPNGAADANTFQFSE